VASELGTDDDFIGHAGSDDFILITNNRAAPLIKQRMKQRFAAESLAHYAFADRARGYISGATADGKETRLPLMTLSVGLISAHEQSFADIREITEVAAEARRLDELAPA